MSKRYLWAIAAVCAVTSLLGAAAAAQNTTTFGNIVAMGVPCGASNCVYYQLPPGTPWVVVQVTGTWAGTLETATTTAPNANYTNLSTIAWTPVATATTNGTETVATTGAVYLRVRATSWASGLARVAMATDGSLGGLMNPVFPGALTATGLRAANGGAARTCWATDGTTTACAATAFSPLEFGAKCDATWVNATSTYSGTDDRPAFRAMLAALAQSGAATIELPVGQNCRVDPPGGVISGFAIANNLVTVQMNNSLAAGDVVTPEGLSTGTYLNGAPLVVLSAGLSATQFEAAFYHADVGTTSDSGYGSSPALDIEQSGLTWIGSGGSLVNPPGSSAASTLTASISAGQHGTTASVGPFVQFSHDKSANVTTWSLDGSGNLTVNFMAMPGGLLFRAGESIVLSNTGTVDATYHSVATVSSTQITVTGVSGSAASGTGGLLHEPWTNFDADGVQGSEWDSITFTNYSRANLTNCVQNWFYCEYVPWTYGFLDYRGGSQVLNNIKISSVEWGFYGVQSDFTHLNNMIYAGGQIGVYAGPNSTPFYVDRYSDFGDDVSVWIDGLPYQGINVTNSHFRSGATGTAQVVMANKEYDSSAALGGGLPTSGVLLMGDNFEFGGGCPGTATPASFVAVDETAMGAVTRTADFHIIAPSFVNYASSPCNVPDFVDVGLGSGFANLAGDIYATASSLSTLTNLINYTAATGSPTFAVLAANTNSSTLATNILVNSGGGTASLLSLQGFLPTNNPTPTGTLTLPSGSNPSVILPYIGTVNQLTGEIGCATSTKCIYFETGGTSPYTTSMFGGTAAGGPAGAVFNANGVTVENNNGGFFTTIGAAGTSSTNGREYYDTSAVRRGFGDGTTAHTYLWGSDFGCTPTPPTPISNGAVVLTENCVNQYMVRAINPSTGAATFTPGTNITSATCVGTCTNQRGEVTIVAGVSATTGTIATVNFSTTLAGAPGLCLVTQNGGAVAFDLGHGTPGTTTFTITAGISVASATITADYFCQL